MFSKNYILNKTKTKNKNVKKKKWMNDKLIFNLKIFYLYIIL